MNNATEQRIFSLQPLTPVLVKGSDLSQNYGNLFIRFPHNGDFLYMVDLAKLQRCLYEFYGGKDAVKKFVSWMEQYDSKKRNSKMG